MNAKQLITLSALATVLASAGGAAFADDITMVKDDFKPMRSRAEVQADVLQARAAGVLNFAVEVETLAPMADSKLSREQVRAELKNSPKQRNVTINPAA